MTSLYFISPFIYSTVYLWMATVLSLAAAWVCAGKDNERLLRGSHSSVTNTWLVASALTLFFGTRPIHYVFGDMVMYRRGFYDRYTTFMSDGMSKDSEPVWLWLQDLSHNVLSGMPLYAQYTLFCFIVCATYILLQAWACVRISKRHSYLLLLMLVANFGFYAYCVNGMRNGMACAMLLLAISYMTPHFADKVKAVVLCLLAFLIHNSVIIPIVALIGAYYILKDTRKCIYVWLASIVVSLVAGSFMENFFVGLGFGDRMSGYITNVNSTIVSEFGSDAIGRYNISFRWDFLLYSAAPIVMGWYVVCKKKIKDRKYELLLNTYILANCVWVMLIRAFFSNRFAYLSWFMYGVVLAYPFLRFKIFKHQGMVLAAVLVGNILFTWLFW